MDGGFAFILFDFQKGQLSKEIFDELSCFLFVALISGRDGRRLISYCGICRSAVGAMAGLEELAAVATALRPEVLFVI